MTLHLNDAQIQDYVDGGLSDIERAAAERHLAGCSECRGSEARQRTLLARIAALPRRITPARDLWPQVSARIAAGIGVPLPVRGPARVGHWALLAAAAVALVGISSAVTWTIARHTTREAAAVVTLPAQLRLIEADYEVATGELISAVTSGNGLAPETVAVLERNLAVIDAAITEARAALARDPLNRDLARMLWSTYDGKLDLLKRATRISAGSGT